MVELTEKESKRLAYIIKNYIGQSPVDMQLANKIERSIKQSQMNKEELLNKLKELQSNNDPEHEHHEADKLLLLFINDPKITEEFKKVRRWYA